MVYGTEVREGRLDKEKRKREWNTWGDNREFSLSVKGQGDGGEDNEASRGTESEDVAKHTFSETTNTKVG